MNSPEFENKVTEERRLSLALDSLREAYSEEQAPPSTEERLLAEFRQASTPAGREFGLAWSHWVLAAAVLLLVCGLVLWLAWRTGLQPPQSIAQAPINHVRAGSVTAEGRSDRIAVPPPQITAAPKPREAKKARNPVATRFGPRTSARYAPGSEKSEPGEFIATMIPTATDADYGLQLVRVELPRRTMMSFGLRVDPRELNRPVKADLIIGPDGLTRAIRFVQ